MAWRRRVWLAKISLASRDPEQLALVHENFQHDMQEALDPDGSYAYYGRTWRLSAPLVSDCRLYGKLGYAKRAGAHAEYVEDEHDWVDAPGSRGAYSHFVLNLETQFLAFEGKSDLSRESFVNAFSRFIRGKGYEIEPVSDTGEFESWLGDVDTITRFDVTVRRPNPGGQKKRAEELRDQIDADSLHIAATARGGLHVRDTPLEGAAEVAALGSGKFSATGIKDGAKRFFDSTKRSLGGHIAVDEKDSSRTILEKIDGLMPELVPPADEKSGSHGQAGGA